MAELLQRNLQALRRRDAALADRIAEAVPCPDLAFESARRESALTATVTVDRGGTMRRVTLASKHTPLTEAERFAESADLGKHAAIAVAGVGLGYHVEALARHVSGKAHVIAYEPDLAMLRAALERVDATAWLAAGNVTLVVGRVDASTLVGKLESEMTLVGQGVQLLTHPPTRQLHGEATAAFSQAVTEFVSYCRTTLVTTLVNASTTCRNFLGNLGHYAAGETVNPLRGAASGRPAVVVAAGPSLARNVHELARPGVRDRVVIIAAQTVLKPLLDRGVRPHFVTALDYHEISRRFYEGLPPVEDITLVAEPKVNPAVLDSYPGPVRVIRSGFLDRLLGPEGRPIDALPAGTTVAHLSFYVAQYLGCDPIMLIGQDLGFSDGLYYCPGTAIHEVWAGELNPFNTLEMLEWKRVARNKSHLRRLEDVRGRPMYSDEQMVTYRQQFERDFADASQQVIDATEGGAPKAHTTPMPLAEALASFATEPLPALPRAARALDGQRLEKAAGLLRQRRREVKQIEAASSETLPLLKEMLERQRDRDRMRTLFQRLEKKRRKVGELGDAFALVNYLNQLGAFKRQRADRAIRVDVAEGEALEKQRRQLERDRQNVEWLIEACRETVRMFDDAADRVASLQQRSIDPAAGLGEAGDHGAGAQNGAGRPGAAA